jgi:hypothetical protein
MAEMRCSGLVDKVDGGTAQDWYAAIGTVGALIVADGKTAPVPVSTKS